MLKRNTVVCALLLSCSLLASETSPAQERASAESAIREQIEGWKTAWNRGDASAIADFYAEDADRTYAHDVTVSGRRQIRDLYEQAFTAELPEDVEQWLTLEILSVRLLTDRIAVVDYAYRATGIPIAPYLVVDGRSTVVMIERNGDWLRWAQRNWIPTTPECMELCQREVSNDPPGRNR